MPEPIPEPESDALARYTGFASDFFPRLYAAVPALRGRLSFHRVAGQPDLFAACDAFSVQLDPDIEVICLWSADVQEEVGRWPPEIEDPVARAIARIQADYLPREP